MVPRHPSQLYEAALEGVVLFLVLRFATHRLKWLQRPGATTGLWLIGYGAIRIALENVRNPDLGMPNFPLGLTMGMMLSIPMILAGDRADLVGAPQPRAADAGRAAVGMSLKDRLQAEIAAAGRSMSPPS